MSTFKVSDNAATRLATSISSSSYVTSLVLTDASKFPVINNGGTGTEYSYITLYNSANNFESVKVTRRDSGSNTLTIVRGTAAGIQGITDDSCIAWSSGTTGVACRLIAQTINDVVQSAASAASSASAASTSAGNAESSAAAAAASLSSFAAASMTLTNKGVNLTSNTLSGTKAQFNTACSDTDFVFANNLGTGVGTALATPTKANLNSACSDTDFIFANDLGTGVATMLATPTKANFNAACSDGDFIFTSDFPWSSNGSPGVTKIAPDGQMEVSRYIDFHPAGGDSSDYTVRLDGGTAGSTTLYLTGNLTASGNVTAPNVWGTNSVTGTTVAATNVTATNVSATNTVSGTTVSATNVWANTVSGTTVSGTTVTGSNLAYRDTNTAATATDYAIGTTLAVVNTAELDRTLNSTDTLYVLSSGGGRVLNSQYTGFGAVTALSGTWRVKGQCGTYGSWVIFLYQRVA